MGENENHDVKMYIAEPDGSYTPFNQMQNLNITYTNNNIFPYISTVDEIAYAFEGVCRASKDAIMTLFGIRDAIIKFCPDKRVVHKKARTRKKNFNRAIKILEV